MTRLSRLRYEIGKHPIFSASFALVLCVTAAIAITVNILRPDTLKASNRTTAAEDIGRRCALDAKRPLKECVAACEAVDGWFDHPCADAAKRTVLGDAGPAKMIRPAPKVAVVAADLDGGPRK